MNLLQKILIPLDGSEVAEKAVSSGEEMARRLGSELLLMSVCGNGESSEQNLSAYLQDKAERLQQSGINSTTVTIGGDAPDQIIDFAERNGIDLIIMSTHGKTGISRWPMGDTCNKVLHESYVPLLLIRGLATVLGETSTHCILVPLDGSRRSEATIPYIASLINTGGSQVILLRVNEAAESHGEIVDDLVPCWEHYSREALSRTDKVIREYLEGIRQRIGNIDAEISCEVLTGKAAPEIIRYAEEKGISLITMSTHGYSGFSPWQLGSVSRKVIEGSTKPILLIRPRPTVMEVAD